MKLDVIIATRNRCAQLKATLASLLRAPVPPGLAVRVNVVDNNSSDETKQVVSDVALAAALPVRYFFEPRKGKSFALNTGLEATDGDLVGFIDDDEEIDSSWYRCIWEAFKDSSLDFIGGPYIPVWGGPKPSWLPRHARDIIGWLEFSQVPKPYGDGLPGAVLCGGNAVLRRAALAKAGAYRTDLEAHEDFEMFERLIADRARGVYLPDLVIYHRIPAARLNKKYFRQWMWRAGHALARIDEKTPAKTIAGVPRYLVKRLIQTLLRTGVKWIVPNPAGVRFETPWIIPNSEGVRFEAELDLIYSVSLACADFRLRKSHFDRVEQGVPRLI
jgi:glycosyltransferase involved in cell wall biosynthesis